MSNDSLFPEDVKERQRRVIAEAHVAKNASTDALQRYEDAVWQAGWVHGYDQGWNEGYQRALAIMQQVTSHRAAPPPQFDPDAVPGLPPKDAAEGQTANQIVLDIIEARPGLRGVELVALTEELGAPLKERTVRTALHRLKNQAKIFNHEERWYPANYILFPHDGGVSVP